MDETSDLSDYLLSGDSLDLYRHSANLYSTAQKPYVPLYGEECCLNEGRSHLLRFHCKFSRGLEIESVTVKKCSFGHAPKMKSGSEHVSLRGVRISLFQKRVFSPLLFRCYLALLSVCVSLLHIWMSCDKWWGQARPDPTRISPRLSQRWSVLTRPDPGKLSLTLITMIESPLFSPLRNHDSSRPPPQPLDSKVSPPPRQATRQHIPLH